MKLTELYQIREVAERSVASIHGRLESPAEYDCDFSMQSLVSLDGCPAEIHGDFRCEGNELTSLLGGPSITTGYYAASHNELVDLKGAPYRVDGTFSVNSNPLKSLEGSPKYVGENFSCQFCLLESLDGAPSRIKENFIVFGNKLTSLHSIHKQIKFIGNDFNASNNPIRSNVLGLMLIDGLRSVFLDIKPVQNIINKHLKGDRDVFACQEELIEAGFEEYAQL